MAGSSLLFIFVTVFSSAAAASLGNKPIPVQNGSSCVVSDPFICKSVGAPEGCPLEMKLTGLTMTGLTEYLTKAILEKHNQVRRKVAKGEYEFANQPNAADMKKLVWNETLASSAQRKVNDQCSFGDLSDVADAAVSFKRTWLLSDPANTTLEMEEDLEKIIQYWFDLVIIDGAYQLDSPFNRSKTDSGGGGKSFHGNALISARTGSMGCGLAIYSKENWRMLEMLCFYESPSMLPTSGLTYEEGPPCSSCQAGFSCDDGLCASSNPLTTTTESGSTESGSTESGSTESGSTESGSTESGSTESGSTESGSTESGSTEGESTESGSTESTDTSTLELEVGKLVRQLVDKLVSLFKN